MFPHTLFPKDGVVPEDCAHDIVEQHRPTPQHTTHTHTLTTHLDVAVRLQLLQIFPVERLLCVVAEEVEVCVVQQAQYLLARQVTQPVHRRHLACWSARRRVHCVRRTPTQLNLTIKQQRTTVHHDD